MSKYLDENGVRKILSKVKYLGEGSTGTGTSDYNQLTNKPSINGIRLSGNKSLSDLGIQALGNYANASDIPTRLSQLTNDRNYLTEVPSEYKTKNENDDLYQEKGNYIVDNNYVHTDNNYTTTEKNKLASLENYVLPTASKTVIGGIKVGANLTIDSDGTLNATGGGQEGTTDYTALQNKPSINGITLSGNKSLSDLSINIPSKLSDLTNDTGYQTSTQVQTIVESYINSLDADEVRY